MDFLVMVPSIFSGAALWLIVSRWMARRETAPEPELHEEAVSNEQTVLTPTVDALAMLDVFAARYDPLAPKIPAEPFDATSRQSNSTGAALRVRCNCGLEFPEGPMNEHAQSTGHSKPFDQAGVKIAKIWDLEEAVIETASPDCVKCGKPVPGLKRIGKTIYVTHLGCASGNKEDKPSRVNRQRAKATTCSICWKAVERKAGIIKVESLSGQSLVFHDECLKLESRSQLLVAEEPGQRYRRTFKW